MSNARKGLGLLALLSVLFAQPAFSYPSYSDADVIPQTPAHAIRKIECAYKDGHHGWGTGFVVADGTIATANHVVEDAQRCNDAETGQWLTITYTNFAADYAVVSMSLPPATPWFNINCDGMVEGRTYYSMGYAGVGDDDLMITRLHATGTVRSDIDGKNHTPFTNMRDVRGVIIGGMSGGPILDEKGRVVAMNNATADHNKVGRVRELKDTYLCSAKKSR